MSYKSLFGNAPAAPADTKVSLFGEDKKTDQLQKIELWCRAHSVMTSANRINFILNGVPVEKLISINITDIGAHQVDEATEANKCVDQVVTEFAGLKAQLDVPKALVLKAINVIESGTKPIGFIERFRGVKPPTAAECRAWTKENIDQANERMRNAVKYHLDPFIEGLRMARDTLSSITRTIEQAIDALDYVIESTKDADLQDLARRRKEMFAKSKALMDMNSSQMHTMSKTCEEAKHFAQELEMTIKPLIENILRAAVINNTDDATAMKEIQTKLKAIL